MKSKSNHIQAYKPFADPVPPNTKQCQLKLTKYQPVLSYTDPVPSSITYNSSSRKAQFSQLNSFSFYDSFDESRTVYLVLFLEAIFTAPLLVRGGFWLLTTLLASIEQANRFSRLVRIVKRAESARAIDTLVTVMGLPEAGRCLGVGRPRELLA